MNVPAVRIAHNLKLIGHPDLGGAPNADEGMGVKITPDGRRILYIAHENPPMAMSILDVTDPSKPTPLWQLPIPDAFWSTRGACSIDDEGVSVGRKLAYNDGGVKPLQYAS